MTLRDSLRVTRLVPVVVLEDAEDAAFLGEALVAGGLPIAEVTFRTAAAEESIRRMSENPDLLVGAGTVVTVEQVDRAVNAGARFIVSPGTSPAVIKRAAELEVPVLPGVATATELMAALESGARTVKFFPASTSGGSKAIAALAAPFRGVEFVPTGGIGPANLHEYLALDCVIAAGGSWMVPAKAIASGDFATVETLCREAVGLAATM